jgi:hypothetical protein
VFTRTGTTWTQQQKLTASDTGAHDVFGCSVSLSGNTALIGAYRDDSYKGSAYVFTCAGSIWTQQQKLLASDGAAGDYFGNRVSLDGNTALIGAIGDDDNGVNSGSAYVFTRTGTTWTQQQKLTASDGLAGDEFGIYVFLDGNTALIGAYGKDHAYVFTKESENQPPNPPTINGPARVKTNVKQDYILNAIDPDGDDVSYFVDWGDGTNSSWTTPSASGVDVIVNHTWAKKGTYTVKAKAKDVNNGESDWTTLSISVPRVLSINYLFLRILQNHPHMFPILRHLMGL